MRQVLLRTAGLLRRPGSLLLSLLLAVGGSLLIWLPLFGAPGYELSAALTVMVGILGGGVGIAAAAQERRLIRSIDPRPAGALRMDSPLGSSALAVAAATCLNLLALLVPFAVSVVYAVTSTHCSPFAQVGFFPLLTLPSAFLAAAVGVLSGLTWLGTVGAALTYAFFLAASAAWTAWPLVTGPQVYAFNHFGGYLPGPLYDEALQLSASVFWFRLETLLLGLFAVSLCAFCLDMRQGRLTRPHLRPISVAVLALLGVSLATLEERGPALRTRMTEEVVADKLGGRRESEHFTLFYARGKPKDEVERTVRDLEYRYAQLASFLGGAPKEKLRVFLYRSSEEKRELVGAAQTQFAKPWQRALHVNEGPFPHAVVKHELVHLMAAPFGSGPFQVTSRFGVVPHIGIIEGLAVAGDDPVDELTLHQWSAGMRRQKMMPNIRQLLRPDGFYAAAPSRAYHAAGSFVRYLAETHGTQKLQALYAHGDFVTVYGRPLDALASEWEAFLDALPLDEAAVNLAFARFRRGSLFSRPCAREVAVLAAEAAEVLPGDPERARALYARCQALQPQEPSFAVSEANALARADRKADAEQRLENVAERVKDTPALAADVAMARADLAWQRDRPEDARAFLEKAIALQVSPAMDRTARIKLAGLGGGQAGAAIWSFFRPGKEELRLLLLRVALEADPRNPFLHYLLGRRLTQSEAPGLATEQLRAALEGDLPDSLRKEALRLSLEAQYLAGDCAGVRSTHGQLPDLGAAFRAQANDWVERCEFEQRIFGGALTPRSLFGHGP